MSRLRLLLAVHAFRFIWVVEEGREGVFRCFCHESLNVHESFLETLAMTMGI